MTLRAPPPHVVDLVGTSLLIEFVELIEDVGRAFPGLTANSWWRDPESNRRAGGDRFSQHLAALAADLQIPAGVDRDAVTLMLRRQNLVAVPFGRAAIHVQGFPASVGLVRRFLPSLA